MNSKLVINYPYSSSQTDSYLPVKSLHLLFKSNTQLLSGSYPSTLKILTAFTTSPATVITADVLYPFKNNQTPFFLNPKSIYVTEINLPKHNFIRVEKKRIC
jgi:hypothetical protein